MGNTDFLFRVFGKKMEMKRLLGQGIINMADNTPYLMIISKHYWQTDTITHIIFLLGEASRLNLEVSVQQRIQSRWTQNFSGQE
jgi:hypothetical protein